MIVSVMLSEATFIVLVLAQEVAQDGASSDAFWSAVAGAAVGGTVSLGTTLLVERQRTKAAGKAERRKELAGGQLAARVIALELRDTESVLRVALERSPFSWPPAAGFQFGMDAWATYGGALGAVLPDDRWNVVAAAYSSFAYSNLLRTVNEHSAQDMLDQTESSIKTLEAWRGSMKIDGESASAAT
jgi:hypothetical protein